MVGIQYNSLADLNGQALAWCNKVNGKVHATTNEVPFERLKKEGLSPLSREYIIDKINLRACLKSFDKNGGVGDNRKKQAGAGENASIPK